jgi:hypothetical protein
MLLTSEQRKQMLDEVLKEHPRFPGFDLRWGYVNAISTENGGYFVPIEDIEECLNKSRYGTKEHPLLPMYPEFRLDFGCSFVRKTPTCCGIIDVGNWGTHNVTPSQERNFKLFIDFLHRQKQGQGLGLRAGVVLAHTNDNYVGVNKLLRECGFKELNFFNANSDHMMSMWTLVLHP